MVKTVIVAYESSAIVVPTDVNAIRNLPSGGGTNFTAAYLCIKDVLKDYVFSEKQMAVNSVSNVVIAFLTDGQGGAREPLIKQFHDIRKEAWPTGPIEVHSFKEFVLLFSLTETGSRNRVRTRL